MMDHTWVRIRSWHVGNQTTDSGTITTRCGRSDSNEAEKRETLPVDGSCETCLRLVARDGDE